ncbi:MAG: sensor histidine kinase [Desulfuromonas sp.]|uniref:ATP-binding protein n=1 Tax=Desulfuromonas thiophila TaxID=57664 RepID=UPI0024A9BC8C|nr:ATP-binding protein [Desulfuromonas thiophila]
MRIKLKHQILLAPAAVLLLMGLLLLFLQYTYWDLSVKRRQASDLGKVFIALAEADLAAKRIQTLSLALRRNFVLNAPRLEEMDVLYGHLSSAIERTLESLEVSAEDASLLRRSVQNLDPEKGIDTERFIAALEELRPQLITLIENARSQRGKLKSLQTRNMDELVARTTLVSLVVMSTAIMLGILLSLFFSRRILRRIQLISSGASNLVEGRPTLTRTPETISDELDDLTVSLHKMAEKHIRVVGAEKLLQGAEDERRRIARDLHDQTLSDLSAILREVQELKREGCNERAERLERNLQNTINNLREVMNDLHPQTLDVLGLTAALQSHLESHQHHGEVEAHFYASQAAERLKLPKNQQLQLYRIAVEVVHNVYKHAAASRLELSLDCTDGQLILAVEDNGRGFTPDSERRGRGLYNIEERARVIGAHYSFKPSRFSSGTRFELHLPLTATTPVA